VSNASKCGWGGKAHTSTASYRVADTDTTTLLLHIILVYFEDVCALSEKVTGREVET
jgi:hypothetical protein